MAKRSKQVNPAQYRKPPKKRPGIHSKNKIDPYASKDLGILRYSVPEFIKNSEDLIKLVNEIKEASIQDGGSGAFYIYLKKKSIK